MREKRFGSPSLRKLCGAGDKSESLISAFSRLEMISTMPLGIPIPKKIKLYSLADRARIVFRFPRGNVAGNYEFEESKVYTSVYRSVLA